MRSVFIISSFLLVLLTFSTSATSFASPADFKLPAPEVETLANGMRVAWFLNDKLPVIDITILVEAGFRDDPAGKSGTAELVAASLDRGALGMSALEIGKTIEMLGGSRYSVANDDVFNVGVHGLAPDADALLDILGKLVIHPDFPEAEVVREHARLMDRWSHIEDYSDALVTLAYHRMITAGTSYGRGNILSAKELQNVTHDDVVKYYKKYFTPKNSILTVVGRINKESFRRKISATFGAWNVPQVQTPLQATLRKNYVDTRLAKVGKGQTITLIDRPNLTQAQIRLGSPSPLITSPEHYSLRVANAFLGELFNSRLNTLMRDKLGLTYSINSSFAYSKEFAEFTISSSTQNETVGQLIHKCIEVLKDFSQGKVTAKEIEAGKDYLIGGFSIVNSTLNAVAGRWLTGVIFGLNSDYLNEFAPKINQVSVADVEAATKKAFDLEHLVVVVAGDAKSIRKSLDQAGFKSIKQVSVSDLK